MDHDLEEVMSYMGEFGKYQAWQYLLHTVGAFTAGIHMLSLVTVAAVPPHQCNIPSIDSDINNTFHSNISSMLPHAIGSCHFLDIDNLTKACDSWTYDTTYYQSSRGMDWNFVCSRRWMGAIAQSAYMSGVFVGSVVLGSLADMYGRKTIFIISAVIQLLFGTIVAFISEYYIFLFVRFLYGIGSAGSYMTGFVLTMEMVGASKRTVCGTMFQVAFSMGFMLVAAWGAIIKDSVWLQAIYGLHSVLLLGHGWFMDESPRWLWVEGHVKEALTIVQKALIVNGSSIKLDEQKYTSRSKILAKNKETCSLLDLLRTPNLRMRTFNVCLNWFANSLVYFGLLLNTSSFVGNPFFIMFLSGFMEVPSYLATYLLMDRTGRRGLISTLMLIGGICCVGAAYAPDSVIGGTGTIVGMTLFGKACIAGSFAIIYNYTAELFPTVLRNSAIGMGSMCARISSSLTPLVMLLDSFDPKMPATVFGLIALVSGFWSLFLPETVNQPLPETLEDGENFGIGDTFFNSCFAQRTKKVKEDESKPNGNHLKC